MDFESSLPIPRRAYLWVRDEPANFQKFIYQSQSRTKTSLESSVLLNIMPPQDVFIMCDLYSSISPQPILSPHFLVAWNFDSNNFPPMQILQIPYSPNSGDNVSGCQLQNVHIFSRPAKKKAMCLLAKLRYKKLWETKRPKLTDDEERELTATINWDYCDSNRFMEKVYIGFTAYIYDSNKETMVKYADTVYSSPIYNSSNCKMLESFIGSVLGGSEHTLVQEKPCSQTHQFHIEFQDDKGWNALASDVRVEQEKIVFKIPAYGGSWQDDEDTTLVHIRLIGCEMCTLKKRIKFLYKREDDNCNFLMP
ncbi:uncharacterized protein isoform X2 [Musca autumnalis]